MILRIQGHSYAYEMENILRIFYPRQKIDVVKGCENHTGPAYSTQVEVRADGAYLLTASSSEDRAITTQMESGAEQPDIEATLVRLLFRLLS